MTSKTHHYRGARIVVSGSGRLYFATIHFRSQEKDIEGDSSESALEKAIAWVDRAPELSHLRRPHR